MDVQDQDKLLYDLCLAEIREHVCSHCIERLPGAPPCGVQGKTCGIEEHLPELIEICSTTDSQLIDPYLERFHDEVCTHCEAQDGPNCPCALSYLLPLAVTAIERVRQCRQPR